MTILSHCCNVIGFQCNLLIWNSSFCGAIEGQTRCTFDWTSRSNAHLLISPCGLSVLWLCFRLPLKQASANRLPLSFSPAVVAVIQHVGYVCVTHVCANDPGPLEAYERGSGCLLSGHVGGCKGSLHEQAAGRNERRDRRTGSGYPPGEASAAAEPGNTARLLVCARFVFHRCWLR